MAAHPPLVVGGIEEAIYIPTQPTSRCGTPPIERSALGPSRRACLRICPRYKCSFNLGENTYRPGGMNWLGGMSRITGPSIRRHADNPISHRGGLLGRWGTCARSFPASSSVEHWSRHLELWVRLLVPILLAVIVGLIPFGILGLAQPSQGFRVAAWIWSAATLLYIPAFGMGLVFLPLAIANSSQRRTTG